MGSHIYIDLVLVDKNKRNKGYGTQLLSAFIKEFSVWPIELDVAEDYGQDLETLLNWYTKFGFKHEPTLFSAYHMVRRPEQPTTATDVYEQVRLKALQLPIKKEKYYVTK